MMLVPAHVSCVKIETCSKTKLGGLGSWRGNATVSSSMDCNYDMRGGESFADDLNENGVL